MSGISLGYQAVPEVGANDVEHRRKLARGINTLLKGKMNAVTSITLQPNSATTTLTDERITSNSFIGFMPTSASAAIANPTIWVSGRKPADLVGTKGTATINHANTADTDKTFVLLIIG